AVTLGLEGTVVDGLRLFDLAVGPGQNLLGGRDRDPDLVEDLSRRRRVKKIHNLLVHRLLLACRSPAAANSKILVEAPCPASGRHRCPAHLCEDALRALEPG